MRSSAGSPGYQQAVAAKDSGAQLTAKAAECGLQDMQFSEPEHGLHLQLASRRKWVERIAIARSGLLDCVLISK